MGLGSILASNPTPPTLSDVSGIWQMKVRTSLSSLGTKDSEEELSLRSYRKIYNGLSYRRLIR